MKKSDGREFESKVYDCILKTLKSNSYVGEENIFFHKKYFSKDRNDYIETDITVEIKIQNILFFIVVIECKDYKTSLDVSEIEEFHSKLQQIGADNTKGIIVTSSGKFKRAAINYSQSKGITLAKLEYDMDYEKYIRYNELDMTEFIKIISNQKSCAIISEDQIKNSIESILGIKNILNDSIALEEINQNHNVYEKTNFENDVKADKNEQDTVIEINNYFSDIFNEILNLVKEINEGSNCDMNYLRKQIKLLGLK